MTFQKKTRAKLLISMLFLSCVIFRTNGVQSFSDTITFQASDGQDGDLFGYAVAMDQNVIVVGAYFENGGLGDPTPESGAAYVFEFNEIDKAWQEAAILRASDGQPGDRFGITVDVSLDTIVVGAYRHDIDQNDPIINAGAAYVFHRDHGGSGNWGQVKKLTASDAELADAFGRAVAISKDTIVVGARLEDGDPNKPVNRAGAVYIFDRSFNGAEQWGEVQKISASDQQQSAMFGEAVAIETDILVVGATKASASTSPSELGSGVVYVFTRGGSASQPWIEQDRLVASDAQTGDGFGGSVAVSGSSIVIGAPKEAGGEGDPVPIAGAVYVFELSSIRPLSWAEVAKLTASDAQTLDEYGKSVDIYENTIAVGAYWEDGGGGDPTSDSGAVYFYQKGMLDASKWEEVEILRASNPQENDYFGRSVHIKNSNLLIGAYGMSDGSESDSARTGVALLMDISNSTPVSITLRDSDTNTNPSLNILVSLVILIIILIMSTVILKQK